MARGGHEMVNKKGTVTERRKAQWRGGRGQRLRQGGRQGTGQGQSRGGRTDRARLQREGARYKGGGAYLFEGLQELGEGHDAGADPVLGPEPLGALGPAPAPAGAAVHAQRAAPAEALLGLGVPACRL